MEMSPFKITRTSFPMLSFNKSNGLVFISSFSFNEFFTYVLFSFFYFFCFWLSFKDREKVIKKLSYAFSRTWGFEFNRHSIQLCCNFSYGNCCRRVWPAQNQWLGFFLQKTFPHFIIKWNNSIQWKFQHFHNVIMRNLSLLSPNKIKNDSQWSNPNSLGCNFCFQFFFFFLG